MKYGLVFGLVLLSLNLFAGIPEDPAALGPAPKEIHQVIPLLTNDARPVKNDLAKVVSLQTPVKSQGSRGTCSIFASTAMLESILKIRTGKSLRLSENYLELLVMNFMKSGSPSEGSDVPSNTEAINQYGTINDATWPYDSEDWWEKDSRPERAEELCGKIDDDDKQKVCYLAHINPDEIPKSYQDEATKIRKDYDLAGLHFRNLYQEGEIKDILNKNYPVMLSLDFFYGAWNHRKMVDYGIGTPDRQKWSQGIVSTPTEKDIRLSHKHPAGHVIEVVGYDDKRRVYFFKNSWGTYSFGVDSKKFDPSLEPGYGSITYEYAHEHGSFYDVFIDADGAPVRN